MKRRMGIKVCGEKESNQLKAQQVEKGMKHA